MRCHLQVVSGHGRGLYHRKGSDKKPATARPGQAQRAAAIATTEALPATRSRGPRARVASAASSVLHELSNLLPHRSPASPGVPRTAEGTLADVVGLCMAPETAPESTPMPPRRRQAHQKSAAGGPSPVALTDAERMPPPPTPSRKLPRSGRAPPVQSRERPASPLFPPESYHTPLTGRSPANSVSGGESAPNTASSMAISPAPSSPAELAGRFGAVLASFPTEEDRRVAPRALDLLRSEREDVHRREVQALAKELAHPSLEQ